MTNSSDPKDVAQAALSEVSAGEGLNNLRGVYIHRKGGLYVLFAVSLDEETLAPLVHYYSLGKKTRWTRTLDAWLEKVEGKPRFVRLRDATGFEMRAAVSLFEYTPDPDYESLSPVDKIDHDMAMAWLGYRDRVREILEPWSDDVLGAAHDAALRPPGATHPPDPERAHLLEIELGVRRGFRRAREVEAEKGAAFSGAYCVFHDGDVADCPPGFHD